MKKKNKLILSELVNDSEELLYRRSSIRWMMVFYDLLFFVLCWQTCFFIHPFIRMRVTVPTAALYFLLGLIFYFGFRLIFECYKCIFRHGKIYAFSREILADIFGSVFLIALDLILSRCFDVANMPFSFVLSFTMSYVVVCVFSRFVYCYLYRFAKQNKPLSKVVRSVLTVLAAVDFDSLQPGAVLGSSFDSDRKDSAPINELQRIVEQFEVRGEIVEIKQITRGYINRTYRVTTFSENGNLHKYLLQRINTNVFPDVDALMENFEFTTKHLQETLRLPGEHKRGTVAMLRHGKNGGLYFRDDSGCWRVLTFFDNVYSLDIPDSPDTFYYAGVAFGRFIKEMSDVDVSQIHEVVPNFHNTLSRYQDLEDAILRDPKGRAKSVENEISFIRKRKEYFGVISDALDSGRIPTRICHNDCNLNNVLFDKDTHLPVAIIDLDTVMPSSPLYDFGDSMRIGTNTAKDDEKDLRKVSCDLNLFEQYARGYLEACGSVLTKEELELLPYASLVITVEDGIRFLMDHINGDTYYNIYYPGQNLDRARTQLKLLEDMEAKLPEIKRILLKIYSENGYEANISL